MGGGRYFSMFERKKKQQPGLFFRLLLAFVFALFFLCVADEGF